MAVIKIKNLKIINKLTTFFIVIVFSFIIFNHAQAVNDAIGVMVYTNKNHYSPSKWYQEEVENPGGPSLIQIDGYEAVVDGRTVYVAATNFGGSDYYTNIYLISYNQDANAETIEIFNQLLDNWHFNTNISSTSTKAKIVRDTKRLADLQNMADLINDYGASNNGVYPQLTAGTFVRGQSNSKWPSWNQTLGTTLSATLSMDPTNEFTGCVSPENPSYDPETCWNESNNDFSCTTFSKIYFYNNYYTGNTNNYDITALTEEINQGNLNNYSTLDAAHINLEGKIHSAGSFVSMCTGGGLGAFCGNGTTECPIGSTSPACDIYVAGGTEQCEPGDTRNYCDIAFGNQNWHQELITGCNNDCTWYVPTGYTAAQCGGYCGDNTRQGQFGEECDGSSSSQFAPGYTCFYNGINNPALLQCNGSCYLTCSSGTLVPVTTSCGNGQLEYPELCDWQSYQDPTPQYSSVDNQYDCKTSGTFACTFKYNSTTYYGYCGDDIIQNGAGVPYINEGEQCDGSTGITTPQVWNCTSGGNISCPEAPDPNACLRICDTGCPYQGACGDGTWQNTGSCHEECENDNVGKTPPHTDCNNTPPIQPPTCTVNGCVSMWQACDGSYTDTNGCEEYLGDNDNCLGCGNVCNYTGGNGIPFCSYSNNLGCAVDCSPNYHCSGDTYPYYGSGSGPYYSADLCPPGDTCLENAVCGDGDVEDWEICDPGPPQNLGGYSCSNLTSPPQPTTPPAYVGGNLVCNATCLNFNEGGCCITSNFTVTFTADNWFNLWVNGTQVVTLTTANVPTLPWQPGVNFWSSPTTPALAGDILWQRYATFNSTLTAGQNVIAVKGSDTGTYYGLIGKFDCGSTVGITTSPDGSWLCTGKEPAATWNTNSYVLTPSGSYYTGPGIIAGTTVKWHAATEVPDNASWTNTWENIFIPGAEAIWAWCENNSDCSSGVCITNVNPNLNICDDSATNNIWCRYIANW